MTELQTKQLEQIKSEKLGKKKTIYCEFNVDTVYKSTLNDDDNEFSFFEGFASTFGNVDLVGDRVERGAFTKSLREKMPLMLWQHNAAQPIGRFLSAEENEKGLFVKGVLPNDIQLSREVGVMLRNNIVSSMSIGFIPIEIEHDFETGITSIKEVDLAEISIVTFPANPKADVTNAKSIINITRAKSITTIKELEKTLREVGFSSDAAKFVAAGSKFEQESECESHDEKASELIKQHELMLRLQNINLQLRR